MRLAQRIVKDEAGFSLTELLTAMVVGSVILGALMTLMTTGFMKSAEITDRAEAAQGGRTAMDRAVTLLDSSVCLDLANGVSTISPLIGSGPGEAGSSDNYVAFYADLDGASETPNKYTIRYDPTAKTLTEHRFDGSGTYPNVTFASSASQTRVLANNIVPARDPSNQAQLPVFSYYKFALDGTVDPTRMTTPIAQADAGKVISIVLTFKVISGRTDVEDARATTITDQTPIGTPDPGTPSAGSCQ